jgi:hypothetical protein
MRWRDLQPSGSTGCHWGGRWYAPANTISRVPVLNGATGQPIPNQYRYTYRVPTPLRATDLDRPMEWIVGSCSEQRTDACTYSAPRPIHFSTRNLKWIDILQDFDTNATGADLSATFYASYEDAAGTNSPGYRFSASMVEARLNSSLRCLQDVRDITVQPTDRVLLNNAAIVTLNDSFNAADVIAILPANGQQFMTVQGVNAGQLVSAQGRPFATTTGSLLWSNPVGTGVAMFGAVDTQGDIVEYAENDNQGAECRATLRP